MRAVLLAVGCVAIAGCSETTAGTPPGDPTAEKSALTAELSATTGDGLPIFATRFPVAPQALRFSGDIKAQIGSGRPQSCGFASGPDNIEYFEFAAFVQAQGRWYFLRVDTDKAAGVYHGPGAYVSQATLTPAIGRNPRYSGTVRLTVTRDSAPDGGTVNGTWRETSTR